MKAQGSVIETDKGRTRRASISKIYAYVNELKPPAYSDYEVNGLGLAEFHLYCAEPYMLIGVGIRIFSRGIFSAVGNLIDLCLSLLLESPHRLE
eukprot:1132022-Amorphochlora_amoeboformis.AAC.1